MEKLKAIFAVSLFVASLIFATPVINSEKKSGLKRKQFKISGKIENDTAAKTQYIYPPDTNSDLTVKN